MKDILTATPLILVLIMSAAFLFAVVMQPIFVWLICARIKRTNQLLSKLAANSKPQPLMPTRKP